jgi:heme O synthase-like polyprenyltransferase
LFAVLWFWQMPHFLAISWMYREDYKRAGFAMLSGRDEDGVLSARQAVVYTFYLLCLSLLPVIYGAVQFWFLPVALLTGGGFLYGAVQFLRLRSHAAARKLFLWSILYLPVFLALYVAALR